MIYVRMYSQDKMNWIMAGFVFLWLIGMLILNKIIRYKNNEEKKLLCNLLCEVPIVVCIFHFIFFNFKGRLMLTILSFGGFYLSAMVVALLPLLLKFRKKVIVYAIAIVITVIGCVFTVGYPAITNCGTRNYSHMNYVDSFEAMTKNMKEYDTLLEWKKINIDQIKDDIMPMVREAEDKDDKALFYAAMCKYTYHFFDGHTWVNAGSSKIQKEAETIFAGNDYGFSMIRLENGETIATLVEDGCDARKNGLQNGTRIVKWNGENIDEAISNVQCIYTKEYGRWPVKENEEMFKPIFLAGKGNDETLVTFILPDNEEKTVKLAKIGSYRERLEKACEIILAKDKLKEQKNYNTYMINDTFGYLRISEEEYGFFSDLVSYVSGSSSDARDMFDKKIDELVKKGMKKLVIDVRNNRGGSSVIPLELTALFTKKDIYINSMAYIDGEKKEIVRNEYVKANGKYADLEVIVLTNSRCVSAGDYLVYCMGKCDNVKVVGTTVSTGSSQPVGGNCVMSDGICDIRYPQNWMLDENGDRFIDTKEDRKSRILLDEKIPLTYQGAMDMYSNNIDYELTYITENY